LDLSFPRFDRATELVVWPGDLAVLMIGVAARQGASRTAAIQDGLGPVVRPGEPASLFAPADGAFNGAMATLLAGWREEPPCRKEE
jgi:hypothetical protein